MKIYNQQLLLRTDNQISAQNSNFKAKSAYLSKNSMNDKFVNSIQKESPYQVETGKNYIRVVSFGALKNPTEFIKPAIQMRVSGVTHFQDNMLPDLIKRHNSFSINRLADSHWQDGDPLDFNFGRNKMGATIDLISPKFGKIGRVPDEISPYVFGLISDEPHNFKFELSNVVAGNTKGASTIGLRVNLLYEGKNPKKIERVQSSIDDVLNDKKAAQKAFLYQPMKSPKEILKEILDFEAKTNGIEAAKKMEEVVNNIIKVIEDPKNKKILLVGHCKPDGDTLGCILGLKNSINMMLPEKIADCAVDDEVTGLFRHKLPGIDTNIKHPYSEEKIKELEAKLAEAKTKANNKSEIVSLENSIAKAKNKDLTLNPDEKYDAVILMDIPSPSRFSSGFKKYIEEAEYVIDLDHHPLRKEEWDKVSSETGINMGKIIENKLAWIADRVPAATQQAVIIASKLKEAINPLNADNAIKTLNGESNPNLNAAVASFTAGMNTDTGGFSRTANLLPRDVVDDAGKPVPINKRPNFWPEGLSKWLFRLTNGDIDKRWMRNEITYDINDEKIESIGQSARDRMVEYAKKNKSVNKDLGLGFVTATYNELHDVLKLAHINESDTDILDVQNGFKYSEVMGELRDPLKNLANSKLTKKGNKGEKVDKKFGKKSKVDKKNKKKNNNINNISREIGKYDNDSIAVFISETFKAGDKLYHTDPTGELTHIWSTTGETFDKDSLRYSFRSKDGTIHAELLASLFNGGGHGGAAGGHFEGQNLSVNSRFSVLIDGLKVSDKNQIFEALMKNYKVKHNNNLSMQEQQKLCHDVQLIQDELAGKKSNELIADVVSEIREHGDDSAFDNSSFDSELV